MNAFLTETEQTIARWFGIAAPNEPSRRLVAELAETIEAFSRLRGTIGFEEEPSSFEAALQATKEGAPLTARGGPGGGDCSGGASAGGGAGGSAGTGGRR
jgi:hypothetical protein